MQYLTQSTDIQAKIVELATAKILWLDTEVADWQTAKPRLSLIQVLTQAGDRTGEFACILDVLNQPDLVQQFIQTIMVNPAIEKVFHNASYDLRYLGQDVAQTVTCTLKLARKIGKHRLGTPNLKLKTLALELGLFTQVDVEEQQSDWGRRSLTPKQLHYAAMDVVYLAAVHYHLLAITQPERLHQLDMNPPPSPSPKSEHNPSLNATKVRIALECPRLFYLHHHFGANPLFSSDGAIGVGNKFHAWADRLVQWLRQDTELSQGLTAPVDRLDSEALALQMQQRFYQHHFYPDLQRQNEQQAAVLLQVWQGLRGLMQRFAELLVMNRQVCPADRVIAETFVVEEPRMEHEFTLPDGRLQRVSGEFDCLVFDAVQQRFCVVEFKTYSPVDPTAQLAQASLYSYLLWRRKQVPIDAAIYCVLPTFQSYHYTWNELEATVHQLIPHKLQQMQQWLQWQSSEPDVPPPTAQPDRLCPICPQSDRCQTLFTLDTTLPSVSVPDTNHPLQVTLIEPSIEHRHDLMGQELVETLLSFGIETTYQGMAVGPAFVRVKLKPQLGVRIGKLLNLADDLRVQLNLTYPPLIAPQSGFVSVDLPRPDRQTARFSDYLPAQSLPPTAPMKIAIGIDLDGCLIEADLADPNTCHFLVGGTTGSGKSEFLRSLLLSLLIRHDPASLQIALVDPKRVTFPEFETMSRLLAPVVKESEGAIALMEHLVDEMDRRYQQFECSACYDLRTYNQKMADRSQPPLPRIVCIFDEYADFMADKDTAKALALNIKRLGAMARAAGIHLIIATQRPEASVVTPLIRSNLPGRIALRTASGADSAIILGAKETTAVALLGKGDLLYKAGDQTLRLQSLYAGKIAPWTL